MNIRITSDIDSKNKLELSWYIYQALKHIKNIKLINITSSNSKGYHLIVWTNHNYSKKRIYELRKLIGDDIRRIKLDKIKKFGQQTLFYKKTKIK